MNRSDQINELAEAFAAFQADVKNPVKLQKVDTGTFSYHFAPLADVLEVVRPLLAKNGLSVVQELVSDTTGGLGCSTLLMHKSGQWITCAPLFVPAGDNAKDIGAAASYARRYALMAALNLAAADDDGAAAPQRAPAKPTASPQRATSTPTKALPTNAAGETMVTERQLGKIAFESKAANLHEAQLGLAKTYHVESKAELTRDQASDLIARLIKHREEQEEQTPAPTLTVVSDDDEEIPF